MQCERQLVTEVVKNVLCAMDDNEQNDTSSSSVRRKYNPTVSDAPKGFGELWN